MAPLDCQTPKKGGSCKQRAIISYGDGVIQL